MVNFAGPAQLKSSSYTINYTTPSPVELDPQKTRTNINVHAGFDVVEMWGLEPQTPYMRSKKPGQTGVRKKPKK